MLSEYAQFLKTSELIISRRAVRVSTHEMMISISPVVCFVIGSVEACHSSPQNKFNRFTRTIDLCSPISDSENGWRKQLPDDTLSPSATRTRRAGRSAAFKACAK